MTDTPDTSPEAVDRLIVWLMDAHETGNTEKNPDVWRILEALSAERDRLNSARFGTDPDLTAPEAVERLAKTCDVASAIAGRRRFKAQYAHHKNCAATLRALSAERNTLKADLEFMQSNRDKWMDAAQSARTERDALKAELAEAVDTANQAIDVIASVQSYKQPDDPTEENALTMCEHEVFDFDVETALAEKGPDQ